MIIQGTHPLMDGHRMFSIYGTLIIAIIYWSYLIWRKTREISPFFIRTKKCIYFCLKIESLFSFIIFYTYSAHLKFRILVQVKGDFIFKDLTILTILMINMQRIVRSPLIQKSNTSCFSRQGLCIWRDLYFSNGPNLVDSLPL